MSSKPIELGFLLLLPAVVFAGSYDRHPTSHYELRAEVVEDGSVVKSTRINNKDYQTSTPCEKDGLLLASPPPARTVGDKIVVYSITCKEVPNK